MGFFQNIGDFVDQVGTDLKLPEWNVSEYLAGNRNTVNSGSRPLTGTNMTPSGGYANPTTYAPYALTATGGSPTVSNDTTTLQSMPKQPTPVSMNPDGSILMSDGSVIPNPNAPAPNTGGTESGNGLEPGYPKPFEGKLYNTPEELAAAVRDSAVVKRNEADKKAKTYYEKGLITYDEYLDAARTNAQTVKKTYDQNMQNIQGYYNKISPDAVQSNQGVTQNIATGDYNTIKAKTGDLFGGKNATDIAGMDLSSFANDITTTGRLARGIQGNKDQYADNLKANQDYMNNVDYANFEMLNPAPQAANTGMTDFLQNLASQVYLTGQPGGGITGQKAPQTIDPYNNPVKPVDEWSIPIK